MTIKQTCSVAPQPVSIDSEWIQVFPAGTTKARDGRGPFVLDDPEAVVTASTDPHGIDLVIDRDHVMDIHPGHAAPAAGWIKGLQVREGAIWAQVEWTDAARAQLKAREYRYISPTFYHEEKTGRVTQLIRASLVNDPAFVLKAVAASSTTPKENTEMDELAQTLAALLGLEGADVSSEAIVAAVQALKDSVDAVKETVDAPEEAETAEQIVEAVEQHIETEVAKETAARLKKSTAAAAKGEPDPAKYVPIGAMKELQADLAVLKNERAVEKATAAVNAALEAGKLTPGQKEWALSLASKDAKAFADFVEKAPAMILDTGLGRYTAETASAQGVSKEESAVAAMLGVKVEDMKAANKSA
jgi:phage I-like protein